MRSLNTHEGAILIALARSFSLNGTRDILLNFSGFGTGTGSTTPTVATPSNLVAKVVAFDTIRLTWIDSTPLDAGTKFQIQRGTGPFSSSFDTLKGDSADNTVAATSLGGGVYTFDDTGALAADADPNNPTKLQPGVNYSYRVVAVKPIPGQSASAYVTSSPSYSAYATITPVNLTIDSNNDGNITWNDDVIEDDADKPGKYLQVDDGFAAGFDLDASQGFNDDDHSDFALTPLTLSLPAWVDFNRATVTFAYSASNPSAMQSGDLRLWLKGGTSRGTAEYLNAGTPYTPAQLGMTPTSRTITLWAEAIRPTSSPAASAIVASVDTTMTATASTGGDSVNITCVPFDLQAHRTGGKLGDEVTPLMENSHDATRYLVLTNNDYEQNLANGGPDSSAMTAVTIPTGVSTDDDDLAKITIKQIPSYLAGSLEIQLLDSPTDYDPNSSNVRLFKSDGTLLYDQANTGTAPLTLLTASPSGYLAGALGGDLDIWMEGLNKDTNFTFAIVFRDTQGTTLFRDDVHVLFAEWTFRNMANNEMATAVPLWKDALLAAANDWMGRWSDTLDAEGAVDNPSFFKVQVDGLPWNKATSLKVASDEYPDDFYYDKFDHSSSGMTRSREYGVLYNENVYLPPADAAMTQQGRELVESRLHFNAVHNPAGDATLTTGPDTNPTDVQERQIKAILPVTITGVQKDLLTTGSTIQGSAKFAVDDWQKYTVQVQLYLNDQLVAQTDHATGQSDQPFNFTLNQPGQYVLMARGWKKQGQEPAWGNSAISILVDNDVAQSPFKTAAWENLRSNNAVGSVPADAVERNRKITESYVNTYNANKDLRYLGMAAAASKLVGDSIASAAKGGEALDMYNLGGVVAELFGTELPAIGKTREVANVVHEAYGLLANGNWSIYMSMYPSALAYLSDPANHPNGNIQAVQNMIPNPKDKLRLAWESLDAARTNQNANGIWNSAIDMVDYEQRVVLQNAIADTPEKRQFWTSFSQNHGAYIRSPYPGAKAFKQLKANGDYGNDDDRMQWFRKELFDKAKQWLVDHPDGIDTKTLLEGGYAT